MKFKELRKKQGFKTAKELAEVLGFKSERISKWEIGVSQPKLQDLDKIAKALSVTVEEIINCFK